MNKIFLLSLILIAIVPNYGIAQETPILIPIGRSTTAPLRFPSDNANQEFARALQLYDDMQLIIPQKDKSKIMRTLTPNTQRLITLDPNLGRTTSENIHEFVCQSSIMEGATKFDAAQQELFEMESKEPNTLVVDNDNYDRYTDIEDRQLEALCIFVTAYEKGCYDAYLYIASVYGSVMSLEKKRKKIKKDDHQMLPKYHDYKFADRLKQAKETEEARKNNRKSMTIPSKVVEPDPNKAHELYARAQLALATADTLRTKVIEAPGIAITALEYQQVENLYCDGLKKALKSFHKQPDTKEKERVFEEIQHYLEVVQNLQKKQTVQGIALTLTDDYIEICKTVEANRKTYGTSPSEKGKVTWTRTLSDSTKNSPRTVNEQQPAQASKSKLQRILDCLPCCKK